jgi:uncharacterized protein
MLLPPLPLPSDIQPRLTALLQKQPELLDALALQYNALESGQVIRPTLGNTMPIHYMRDRQTYLFVLFPELLPWAYEMGKAIGRQWNVPQFESKDLPTLLRENAPIAERHHYAKCEILSATATHGTYRMYECADCHGLPNLGLHLCVYEAGTCAGVLEKFLNQPVTVRETRCCAHGDPFCEFEITVISEIPS